jgi:hypothetical protein
MLKKKDFLFQMFKQLHSINPISLGLKKCHERNLKNFSQRKSQEGQWLKIEWANSIEAPSRKLKWFSCKLADSTTGVAPNM